MALGLQRLFSLSVFAEQELQSLRCHLLLVGGAPEIT